MHRECIFSEDSDYDREEVCSHLETRAIFKASFEVYFRAECDLEHEAAGADPAWIDTDAGGDVRGVMEAEALKATGLADLVGKNLQPCDPSISSSLLQSYEAPTTEDMEGKTAMGEAQDNVILLPSALAVDERNAIQAWNDY